MKYLILGLFICLGPHLKASNTSDTIYVLFTSKDVTQKKNVQMHRSFQVHRNICEQFNPRYKSIMFTYTNKLPSSNGEMEKYKIAFIHSAYFDSLDFTVEVEKAQQKILKDLYESPYTCDSIKRENTIRVLKRHLDSKTFISRKSIVYKKSIKISSLLTEKQLQVISPIPQMRRVVYLIDATEDKELLPAYIVHVIPLQPIRLPKYHHNYFPAPNVIKSNKRQTKCETLVRGDKTNI